MDFSSMRKVLILVLLCYFFTSAIYASSKDSLNITFQSDGYQLNGKLIKPENPEGKIPAIIFLVGSGGYSSHSKDYKEFLEFFLEIPFQDQEVSFLYFDKRGIEPSEGKWYKTSFQERAIDARNAAEYLRKLPYIDQEKIYLVGHSQGGWIVQIALAEFPDVFAGGVSMAGPTFGVRLQLINDYQSQLICSKNLSAEEAWEKATRQVKRDLTFVSLVPIKEEWKQLNVIKNFDPSNYLLSLKKPLLMMFAENDALVNPNRSLENLKILFPEGIPINFSTHISSGENHSFKQSELCGKSSREYSAASRKALVDWLNGELKSA